jgi:hypothetical protein
MELRLRATRRRLIFAWVRAPTAWSATKVPRSLIAEIETQPTAWKGVRDDVAQGLRSTSAEMLTA